MNAADGGSGTPKLRFRIRDTSNNAADIQVNFASIYGSASAALNRWIYIAAVRDTSYTRLFV